jgi:hypothetical protein
VPRSVRFVLPAIICLLASITVIPASDAMITSTPNVHDWLFDTSGRGGVDTQSEAVTVAKRYDVVIAAQRYYPFLSAMKKTKPGIVVALYHKGTSVYGSDFTMIKSKHPDWLLHTKSGALLKSSYGTYLIDPGNSGVRSWEAAYAKQSQSQGWTGVYLDSMGLYGFSGFTGTPINPRTHSAYTTAQWIKDEEGLAAAVRSAISVPLIINGLRTGPGYFKDTSPLVSGIDGGEFEGCFRDANAKITNYPSTSSWLSQVKALEDVQSKGRTALCWTKTWTSATSSQISSWHTFALASFMLANQGSEEFFFSGHKSDNGNSWYGDDKFAVGSPSGSLKSTSGGAYYRAYSKGMVVVNPTGGSLSVPLGAVYVTTSGARVSTVKLSAHTGMILTS